MEKYCCSVNKARIMKNNTTQPVDSSLTFQLLTQAADQMSNVKTSMTNV